MPRFSLSEEMLTRIFTDIAPAYQAESSADLNLGFGFLYYALGRILRPRLSIVLGSQKGFSAICIAIGMRDNANGGKMILVDAGYDDQIDGPRLGHGGVAFWKDLDGVKRHLDAFGVADMFEVKVMRTSEFAELYRARSLPPVDFLLVDADHSYDGFKYDFETYSGFVRAGGVILCHDTEVEDGYVSRSFGIGRYLKEVIGPDPRFEAVSLPIWPGLGIIVKRGPVMGAPQKPRWRALAVNLLRSVYYRLARLGQR